MLLYILGDFFESSDHMKTVILGGDARQQHLGRLLKNSGYEVSILYGDNKIEDNNTEEIVSQADTVIFPLPVSRDGITLNAPFYHIPIPLTGLLERCAGKRVLGGGFSPEIISYANSIGISPADYLSREEMSIMNSLATAEGALAVAINNTPKTVNGSRFLVIGYGRIGKLLSRKLKVLGGVVTVSARKPADLAMIQADGNICIQTDSISDSIANYDVIFNTVPTPVVGENALKKCQSNTVLIELASAPGGFDRAFAEKIGLKVISAQSLPGKTAPLSAAEYIHNTILNIFREWGL